MAASGCQARPTNCTATTASVAPIWESDMAEAIELKIGPDAIAVVTWRGGLLNAATVSRFADMVDRVMADDDIKGAIITGAPAFDLEWLLEATTPGSSDHELQRAVDLLNAALRKIETADRPFVAVIDGNACGAGYEIALACRRRIAVGGDGIQLGLT